MSLERRRLLRLRTLSAAALLGAAVFGCGGGGSDAATPPAPAPAKASAAFVAEWNGVVAEAFARRETAAAVDPADSITPVLDSEATRYCTMVFVAVHDALNAVERRFQPAVADRSQPDADSSAAVASATHTVLAALLPEDLAWLDAKLADALATLPAGAARDAGVALGRSVGEAVLAAPQSNPVTGGGTPVYSSNAPGEYRFTRCPQDAAQTNFSNCGPIRRDWAGQPTWVLTAPEQFRPDNPYGVAGTAQLDVLAAAVQTPAYTADYEEVRTKGVASSSTRTGEESAIAMFWEEASHRAWNRVAQSAAQTQGLDAWQQARLTALLHLALADTWIGVYEAKYHFNMWRPISAIHYADQDGNPDTALHACPPTNVFCWNRFGRSTPPTQEYPSAHAALGGAAERVIAGVLGSDAIAFSLTAQQPGNPTLVLDAAARTRSFGSFTQAAEENAYSRVLIGFHFRESTRAGLTQGRRIGDHVVAQSLQPE